MGKLRFWIPQLVCMLSLPLMDASTAHPRVTIDAGGYLFSAPYKLEMARSTLLVRAEAFRLSAATLRRNGPLYPGFFGMKFTFHLKDHECLISTCEYQNKHHERRQGIHTESGISTSSEWQPALHALLTRYGAQFDPDRNKQKKYSLLLQPKAPSSLHVTPLSGCKLHTTYKIRVLSPVSHRSPLSYGLFMDLFTEEKVIKKYGSQAVVLSKATFRMHRPLPAKNRTSTVQFLKTRSGLKEISLRNFKRSSIWYPWVKKAIEKSVCRFAKYKKKHAKAAD